MTTFRFEPTQIAIAAGIGAGAGLVFHLDQMIVGRDEIRAVADVVPATGFWPLVLGSAALAVALLFFVRACQGLSAWCYRLGEDPRHAHHCMQRRRKYQARYRCTCEASPQNWSPEQRRQAFRALEGGRE